MAWLRPSRLGPRLAVWSGLGFVAGVSAAFDPRYGPKYLLVGPGAYAVAQVMFRVSVDVDQAPRRRRNWWFAA